jgi:hypothetical protein
MQGFDSMQLLTSYNVYWYPIDKSPSDKAIGWQRWQRLLVSDFYSEK